MRREDICCFLKKIGEYNKDVTLSQFIIDLQQINPPDYISKAINFLKD